MIRLIKFAGLVIVGVGIFYCNSLVSAQDNPPRNPNSVDQTKNKPEDAAKLIRESQQVFANEIAPIEKEGIALTALIQAKISYQMQFMRALSTIDDDSLPKVRKQMLETAERLTMLERLESVLVDMDPEAISKAMQKGETYLKELQAKRSEISQPLNRELSGLIQTYAHRNQEIADALNEYFKPSGTEDLVDLKRKYAHGNFAYRQFSCRYETKSKSEIMDVTFRFDSDLDVKAGHKGTIDNRHVIYQWNENSITLLVNGFRLDISSPNMQRDRLMAATRQLIDLDGLARLRD